MNIFLAKLNSLKVDIVYISRNKIVKIMKIFMEIDKSRLYGALCKVQDI